MARRRTPNAPVLALLGVTLLLGTATAAQADPATGDVVRPEPGQVILNPETSGGGNQGESTGGGPGGSGGSGGGGGTNGPAPCTPGGPNYYYLYDPGDPTPPPAGKSFDTGGWFRLIFCDGLGGANWFDFATAPPAAVQRIPNWWAGDAAMRAILPQPLDVKISPPKEHGSAVKVPVWYWIDLAGIRPSMTATESAGDGAAEVTAKATVQPYRLTITTGDGATITCGINGDMLGTPYPEGGDPAATSPDCGHTYLKADQGYPVRATLLTTVDWEVVAGDGTGDANGTFSPADGTPVYTSAPADLRVAEVQTIN